jgi:hypothetical protein
MGQFRNTLSSGLTPIKIRNTTSEVIPPNSCVAIGETTSMAPGIFQRPGAGPGEGRAVVPVRKPDSAAVATQSTGLFLVTLDYPIQPDKEGYATASYPVWVRADSSVTDRGQQVKPKVSSHEVEDGDGFFAVMDIKTIGGQKYAWVTIGGSSGAIIIMTPEAGIPPRSGTMLGVAICDTYEITSGNELLPTGQSVEVLNMTATPVEGDAYGQAKRISGRWVIDVEECEVDEPSSSSSVVP